MHQPFLALMKEGRLDARLRLDFLHQDPPNANPPLPTLSDRLKNSFPFFGNDWIRTGGIGEFTGGGLDGLRAIARAGWRGEDHSLSLQNATQLITARETVNKEIPIGNLRWIISHIPAFPQDLADRANALGIGVLVGWGPTRTGTNVGPPYRMLMNHPIKKAFHSDGGDITVINPWLNFSTMITGKNLAGQQILGDQVVDPSGDALAGDRGDEVVHLGGRPRLDRGRQSRRSGGARSRLLHGARRRDQASAVGDDGCRRQGRAHRGLIRTPLTARARLRSASVACPPLSAGR
jgi:hypothetical protein